MSRLWVFYVLTLCFIGYMIMYSVVFRKR